MRWIHGAVWFAGVTLAVMAAGCAAPGVTTGERATPIPCPDFGITPGRITAYPDSTMVYQLDTGATARIWFHKGAVAVISRYDILPLADRAGFEIRPVDGADVEFDKPVAIFMEDTRCGPGQEAVKPFIASAPGPAGPWQKAAGQQDQHKRKFMLKTRHFTAFAIAT